MTGLAPHLDRVATVFALGTPHTVMPLQPGFVAHAHRIQTATHDVMVKTYDRTRAITARMLEYAPFYLSMTAQLAQHAVLHGRIAPPLARADATFLYDDDIHVSAVFAYVHGVTPRNTPLTTAQLCDMAHTMAHVHRLSATMSLPASARIETFVPRWDTRWYRMLTSEWQQLPPELQSLLDDARPSLVTLFQRMRQVSVYLRAHPLPMVLCHSDIHGWNVIVQGAQTCLIDFEGLVLAPAEQDLFCWYGDTAWPAIFATYQQVVGGHVLNPQALYFYQVKRYLEDIYEWVAELCDAHLDATLRREYTSALQANLTYCKHMLNNTGHAG